MKMSKRNERQEAKHTRLDWYVHFKDNFRTYWEFLKKNKTITNIIIWLLAPCIIWGLTSYIIKKVDFLSNLLLSLSVALLQLFLGIIIVNIYMTRKEKKLLMTTASQLFEGDFLRYNSDLVFAVLEKISLEEYIALRYNRNNGAKEFGDIADKYIVAVSDKYQLLLNDMDFCLQQLKIVISTGGINDEQDILFNSLGAERIFNELKNILDTNNPSDYNKIIWNHEGFASLILGILNRISCDSIENYITMFSQSVKKASPDSIEKYKTLLYLSL